MSHAIVRTDNMSGTTLGKDLVALKYQVTSGSTTTDTAIDNGNIVVVGAFDTAKDVRLASTPAVDSALNTLALIATEEIDKTKKYNTLAEFTNAAGAIARGYRLRSGDIFSVTADALSAASTIAVGNIAECQAGTKLKIVATATSGSTTVGKVIAIEGDFYVIEVA